MQRINHAHVKKVEHTCLALIDELKKQLFIKKFVDGDQ